MKVALGTIEVTEFQARAIALATSQKMNHGPNYYPKWPRAATRQQCREWLQIHGLNGLGAAEQNLHYLKERLDSKDSWRRGQPRISDPGTSSLQELLP